MAEPWFRMHANPTKLKVTARFMEYAKVDKMRAVGHLATFWGAISQHCAGGIITGVPDSLIEEWADWHGKKGVFASFVRLLHSTDGKVNDYEEYSGVLDVTREKNKKRKQEQRDKERASRGRHADVTGADGVTSGVTSEATIRDDTRRYETTTPPPPHAVRERFSVSAEAEVVERFLTTLPTHENPISWCHTILGWLDGLGMHPAPTTEDIAVGLTQYLTKSDRDYSPRHVAGYVNSARDIRLNPKLPSAPRARMNPADKVSQTIAEMTGRGQV